MPGRPAGTGRGPGDLWHGRGGSFRVVTRRPGRTTDLGDGTPATTPPPLRLTWVQPEDLVGHELRQAAEDGRDATTLALRWRTAGGPRPPERAGASPAPAAPALRALACRLLDELALLPSPLAADEPTALDAIAAARPPRTPSIRRGRPRPPPGPSVHGKLHARRAIRAPAVRKS
ncbi:hypothetical protein LIU39_31285, partial [Streptomyces sp. SF28]|nr:hypothetical protein [Streptomyces pinistramenti]